MVARRVTTILVLVPIAVILIALSVANRGLVSLTIDPFNPGNPALSYTAPLFIWLFGRSFAGNSAWLAGHLAIAGQASPS